MGDFSTTWLALREPVDSRARSTHLLRSLQARLSTCERSPGAEAASPQPLRILDLGCGTGANLRYLAPRLGLEPGAGPWARQDWICVDRDRRLLADLTHRTADWARGRNLTASVQGEGLIIQGAQGVLAWGPHCRVRTLGRDLARGSESLLLGPGTLVVASALLDLVSADWLTGLLRACARSGSHLFLALTYDGRVGLVPEHPHDGTLLALVNAHQGRDKGLGPALGPSAPARLAELAAGLGFALEGADSDWVLGPDEPELQAALVAGWAVAAQEQLPAGPGSKGLGEAIDRWHESRQAQIAAGLLHVRVGHRDALLSPLGKGSETSGARLAQSRVTSR
ncbi:MAG: class I SAM-dependent methyltransferase [Chromatiaceae bacterium]|nr:class I SAM-dependent methyltransferase [Chromatiaceae bacterium]